LGAFISNGIARFTKIIADEAEFGSAEVPSGITLYTPSGEPYCVALGEGGELVSTAGECSSAPLEPDITAPIVTLLGANPVYIAVGGVFTDPWITVSDDSATSTLQYTTFLDGLETTDLSIDTSTLGNHIITYRVTDEAGNATTVTRSVIVGDAPEESTGDSPDETPAEEPSEPEAPAEEPDPTPADTIAPVVILVGDAAMEIVQGEDFVDPGATATDETDGDLTSVIVISGSVDTITSALYTLTYSATDTAGNTGEVSRVVNVIESEPAPEDETATTTSDGTE
jgi:hypothetical protein